MSREKAVESALIELIHVDEDGKSSVNQSVSDSDIEKDERENISFSQQKSRQNSSSKSFEMGQVLQMCTNQNTMILMNNKKPDAALSARSLPDCMSKESIPVPFMPFIQNIYNQEPIQDK